MLRYGQTPKKQVSRPPFIKNRLKFLLQHYRIFIMPITLMVPVIYKATVILPNIQFY